MYFLTVRRKVCCTTFMIFSINPRRHAMIAGPKALWFVVFGPLAELNNTPSSLHPPISSKKKHNRLTMRTTKEKRLESFVPIFNSFTKTWMAIHIYIFGIGADCHAIQIYGTCVNWLPNNVNYFANAMTVIRTGQQDYFSASASQQSIGTLKECEVWKLCKREICTA